MANPDYKAKDHYQNSNVAHEYDEERFTSWIGRVSHETESQALGQAVDKFFHPVGSVLDVPCGTGRLWPTLLSRGFEVTGGDISDEMMKVARDRFSKEPNTHFQKMDAEKIDAADNAFDYLTSYRLMCHLPADARFRVLTEMMRVTRRVVIVNYHFVSVSPLALFNRAFRKNSYVTYPLTDNQLRKEIALMGFELCQIKRLSWYERSSALVVIRKRS